MLLDLVVSFSNRFITEKRNSAIIGKPKDLYTVTYDMCFYAMRSRKKKVITNLSNEIKSNNEPNLAGW